MASSITKLLSKKGKLTGAEIGNLIVLDLVSQLVDHKSLISTAEATTAVNSLSDNEEIKTFNKINAIGIFLGEIRDKMLFADLLVNKTLVVLNDIIKEAKTAMNFMEMPKAKRLTYAEYETYRKEKLAEYLSKNKTNPTLFELALAEIRELYDRGDEQGIEFVENYREQPLNEEEQRFYNGVSADKLKCDWTAKTDETKELLEQGKYKEAVLCYLSDKHDYIEPKNFDKGDIAYDLLYYWQDSDQSKETFKKIISDYEAVLTHALEVINTKYFEGKLKDIKLEDTLDHEYTLQELYEKHCYDLLPDVLNSEPILLSEYKEMETVEDIALRYSKAFLAVKKEDMFKEQFETYEEALIGLENMNALIDLAKDELGIKEIERLKMPTEDKRTALIGLYLLLCQVAFSAHFGDDSEKEDAIALTRAVKKVCEVKPKVKPATQENIEKAKTLLRSNKKFKEYQSELFTLIVGAMTDE